MRNRIFYVIHLDIERILILFFLLFFIAFLSFFIGFRIGKNQIKSSTEITLNSPVLEDSFKNKERKEESIDKKNIIPVEELEKAENFSNKELKKQEIEFQNVEEHKSVEKQKDQVKQDKKENSAEIKETIKKRSNSYMIQIGAYKNKEEANQILNQLKEFGIDCAIQKKKNLYIVYSNTNSLESAKKIKKDLEKLNFKDSMIIKNK